MMNNNNRFQTNERVEKHYLLYEWWDDSACGISGDEDLVWEKLDSII